MNKKYQPHLPEEIEAYNEGLELARKIISKHIGKCLMLSNYEGDVIIDKLNELDKELMNIINQN